MLSLMLLAAGLAVQPGNGDIESQPLPEGVQDTGINVLYDSSHQFAFWNHWGCQDALRQAGHRVTGNQASLHRALTPGTPMRVREQSDHSWGTNRPFTMLPAPAFDVAYTYQGAEYQPYLDEEHAALRQFVESGGGLVMEVPTARSPLGRLAEEYGARVLPDPVEVSARADEAVPGVAGDSLPRSLRVAEFTTDWDVVIADEQQHGALAWRPLGKGVVICLVASELLHAQVEGEDQVNSELLSWLVTKAAQGPKTRDDERRLPWEYGGLGGAFYPENEMEVGGVRVLYADNQLPDIIELARTRFTEVMDLLQKMLPTPPIRERPSTSTWPLATAADGRRTPLRPNSRARSRLTTTAS